MTDVHKPHIRSYNMSQIKGKNTKPEVLVRKFLHAKGFRFRLHDKNLPGKPDIILKKHKTLIFVNGCFWHGHTNCKYFIIPKTRTDWWLKKINKTQQNDLLNYEKLNNFGWKIIVIWECELKNNNKLLRLEQLIKDITN